MRIALRTLFWLVLAAAVAIGWGLEHTRAAARLAGMTQRGGWPLLMSEPSEGPSEEALARRAKLAELRKLSDAELVQWFHGPNVERRPGWDSDYDLGLSEMVRRGMVAELQRQYDALMAKQESGEGRLPNNTKLLIALRRAQGKPDPLKIHVAFRHNDWQGQPIAAPSLTATIENVDVEQVSVDLTEGFDDRSGRRTRWRVHLTDKNGKLAPHANFASWGMGGGIGTWGSLEFGERGSWTNWLDARSYVAPLASGEYQLQLIHSDSDIADEPDLTGLIVLKSEPIDVIVTRPPLAGSISVVPLLVILGMGGLWGVVAVVRGRRRRSDGPPAGGVRRFPWRDAVAFVIVAALAVGCWCDSRYLGGQIRASQLGQDADWTMRLVE